MNFSFSFFFPLFNSAPAFPYSRIPVEIASLNPCHANYYKIAMLPGTLLQVLKILLTHLVNQALSSVITLRFIENIFKNRCYVKSILYIYIIYLIILTILCDRYYYFSHMRKQAQRLNNLAKATKLIRDGAKPRQIFFF